MSTPNENQLPLPTASENPPVDDRSGALRTFSLLLHTLFLLCTERSSKWCLDEDETKELARVLKGNALKSEHVGDYHAVAFAHRPLLIGVDGEFLRGPDGRLSLGAPMPCMLHSYLSPVESEETTMTMFAEAFEDVAAQDDFVKAAKMYAL